MERLIALLLFGYFVLFPFGQLGRISFSAMSRLVLFSPPPRSPFGHLGGVLGHFANLGALLRQFSALPEIHFYLTDIILFLLLCAWGIWRFGLVKKKYRLPSLAIPIFSFSAIGLFSLSLASPLLSNREVVVAGLYWLRWTIYAGFYFALVDLKKEFKWLNRENLLNFLIGLGVMVAIFGLAQYCLWPNLRPLEEFEWDPHYYRVVGTFLDPGFTGIILALTMILIVESFFTTFHLRGAHDPTRRSGSGHLAGGILAFSGIAVYLALALTYSRASYLAYIVGIAVIARLRKVPKLFVGAVLIGVLTLIILPRPPGEGGKLSRTYSIEARIKNWHHSIIITRDHPVLGVGFNAYRYAQRDYGFLANPVESDSTEDREEWLVSHSGAGADSSLLFVLATTGILGFLSYLWIWKKAVVPPPRRTTWSSFRLFGSQKPLIWLYSKLRIQGLKACHLAGVLRRSRGNRSVALASLAAVFAHSWFLNSLFYPWVMAWVWVLLATESN